MTAVFGSEALPPNPRELLMLSIPASLGWFWRRREIGGGVTRGCGCLKLVARCTDHQPLFVAPMLVRNNVAPKGGRERVIVLGGPTRTW